MPKIRPIAIHLPQFHPTPENDEWWGKGFTEWTNVTKAKPLFEEHYHPHLPTDLGFYDLRLEEARLEQEKLAKEFGIYGFCYYHYWFNGKKILHEPVDRKLKNPKEDLPFMLCWANENWTRVWDGGEKNVLLEQNYDFEDHKKHIQYLIPFFKDERYIKIDGKAVFAVYRTTLIPNFDEVAKMWKEEARKHDVELYITRFESFGQHGEAFMSPNIDASIEFQPHSGIKTLDEKAHQQRLLEKENFKSLRDEISIKTIKQSYDHWKNKLGFNKNQTPIPEGRIVEYSDFITADIDYQRTKKSNIKTYSCVSPGFDNSARRSKNYFILNNSTPELYADWLEKKLELFKPFSKEENLFFINAWNEWAEGNHLEPCQKWKKRYLDVTKEKFNNQ